MAENTGIEWAHDTFNPWWGCQRVSPGCQKCYAQSTDARWHADDPHWGPTAPRKMQSDGYWRKPLSWNRKAAADGVRRRVFCASMADVFEARDDLYQERLRLWDLIADTPHLDWLLLTKRPENFKLFLPWLQSSRYFMPNVWLGVTAEDQQRANERIPILINTPAALRFVSYEPALEKVLFDDGEASWLTCDGEKRYDGYCCASYDVMGEHFNGIDWIIAGAESGPGARPAELDWFRSAKNQCVEAGVPFFFKQKVVGGVKVSLPKLDGRTWAQVPEGIR